MTQPRVDPTNPFNPYTPPQDDAAKTLPFFEVGVGKFITMSLVTFGAYPLYWAYRQWKLIKARAQSDISPFWRAFFGPLWGYSLLKEIHAFASSRRIDPGWGPGFLGFAYFAINITWRLPDPWWLISLLAFVPLIPGVDLVIKLHSAIAPSRDRNVQFNGWNKFGIVFGGLLLIMGVIGTFLPEPTP